jgi:hypothetical protein
MQMPGVHIETIHNPRRYTYAGRGKLVRVEPPKR